MTQTNAKPRTTRQQLDDDIRQLLVSAGPRPEVADPDLARLRETARREWTKLTPRRRRRSPVLPVWRWAAAGLVLSLAATWWWLGSDGRPALPAVATVELIRGDAWLEGSAGDFEIGGALAAGTELVTGNGDDGTPDLAAVRLGGGQSVRLDRATRLRLLAVDRVELVAGAVYVDSGERPSTVEIVTPFGRVLDVGTQFEVRLAPGPEAALVVRVRRGSVSLLRDRDPAEAARAGEELTLHADGSVERAPLAATDAVWGWVLSAAPSFELEGSTLREFLGWVELETGWRIELEAPVTADSAGSIELHGTIEGLRPDEAVAAVLPGCGLDHDLAAGVLTISESG